MKLSDCNQCMIRCYPINKWISQDNRLINMKTISRTQFRKEEMYATPKFFQVTTSNPMSHRSFLPKTQAGSIKIRALSMVIHPHNITRTPSTRRPQSSS